MSPWMALDYLYRSVQGRSIVSKQDAGSVSGPDVVQWQVTPDAFVGDPNIAGAISTIVTVTSYTTASFAAILNGPWTAIRGSKSGAGGTTILKVIA